MEKHSYTTLKANTTNLRVEVRSQYPFVNAGSHNATRIDLTPNGYTVASSHTLAQTGIDVHATELSVTRAHGANLERGMDLVDDPTDAAEDLAMVYTGSGWELARTDALLSAKTTGLTAKSYEFESYRALVVNTGGSGYKVGDVLTITGGQTAATVEVTAIDNEVKQAGSVLSFKLTTKGAGYSTGANVSSSPNSGTGSNAHSISTV